MILTLESYLIHDPLFVEQTGNITNIIGTHLEK